MRFESVRAWWFLVVVGAVLCALSLGCESKKEDEAAAEPDYEAALTKLADRAQEAAAMDNGLLPDTGVMVYCRGGSTVTGDDSIFKKIDFEPPSDVSGADFCFNVSSDRKKVALSVAKGPTAETKHCLKLDLSGEKSVRSKVEETKECMP